MRNYLPRTAFYILAKPVMVESQDYINQTFSKLDMADSRQTLFGDIERLMNEIHAPLKMENVQ